MAHTKRTHQATDDTKTIVTGKGNRDTTSSEVVVDDAAFPQLPVSPRKQAKKDEKHAASPRAHHKKKDETPLSPRPHKQHKKEDDAPTKVHDTQTDAVASKEEVLVQDTKKDEAAVKNPEKGDVATEDTKKDDAASEVNKDDAVTEDEVQPEPTTYTAMTVDRAAIQGSGDPAEPGAIANQVDGVPNVQAVAYDQQDGITKATNVTLPPGSLPDIVPGVPNVPLTSLLGTNTTQDLGAIPLPDIIPGVPNVPAIVVTNPDAEPKSEPKTQGTTANETAQIQPGDVELKQLPRFAQQ